MNITNNSQPIPITSYKKPLIFINNQPSNRTSRSNSYESQNKKNLPILYDSVNKKSSQLSKMVKQEVKVIKQLNGTKEFYNPQQKVVNQQLIYPPPLPSKQFQRVIVKPSNKQFIVNNSRSHSKSSHNRGSQMQNRNKRSISSHYANKQYSDKIGRNEYRQKTSSSYSSKSSTKIIIQTVRPLEIGNNNTPIYQTIHHKFETQFKPRQNYHLSQQRPMQINSNHQFIIQNKNIYHSPQATTYILDTRGNMQNNTTFYNADLNRSKHSEVFRYPLKKSINIINNQILQVQQNQRSNHQAQNSLKDYNQLIKNCPVTFQSKIYEYKNEDKLNVKEHQNDIKSGPYLEYQTNSSNIYYNTIDKNKNNIKQGVQILKNPVQTIINREQFNSQKFYESSRRMIDQIFQKQTQSAMLRMKSFDIGAYRSPGKVQRRFIK